MPKTLQLTDLFPTLMDDGIWPYDIVPARETSDVSWLVALNNAVHLFDLRTFFTEGSRYIQCRFEIHAEMPSDFPAPLFPEGFIPFRLRPVSSILFRALNLTNEGKRGYLYIQIDTEGRTEILIEGLPVEIVLPTDLLGKHPDEDPDSLVELTEMLTGLPGKTDAQVIVLKDNILDEGSTSIFTHLRLHVSPELTFQISTPTPISFGKCSFMGFPCLAVHDFQMLPSPQIEHDSARSLLDGSNWIRHGITGQFPGGAFGIRSAFVDFASSFWRNSWPNYRFENEKADWVFEDLVMTLDALNFGFLFPLPLQATIGIRRNREAFDEDTDIFEFDSAAFSFPLTVNNQDIILFRFYQLFFKSEENGLGVFVKMGIAFGDDASEQDWEIRFESDENLTFRLGAVLLPDKDFPLRIRISDDIIIDPFGLTIGYSFGKANQGGNFGDCFEVTASTWIHDHSARLDQEDITGGETDEEDESDTGGETSPADSGSSAGGNSALTLKKADDSPFSCVITNIGWKQGNLVFETFSLPEGTGLWLGPVQLEINELGMTTEDAATYFSLSGGVLIKDAERFEGGVWFRRLRFRIGGDTAAPPFKLDGFNASLKIPNLIILEIGGYFIEERTPEYFKKEIGLTGTLALKLSGNEWIFSVDWIGGRMERFAEPVGKFSYMMLQIFIQGQITIATVQLISIRFLLSINMKPELSSEEAGQNSFRYYAWQKSNDPINVPGDRRLRAWEPQNKALSFGFGFRISFAGMGDVVRLNAFFMYVNAPEDGEEGFLVAIEMYFGKSTRPVAWAILEYDMKHEKFAIQIGVDLTISNFIQNASAVWESIFRIRGTIFIGNKPGTFALGRLDDQHSWMMLLLDLNLFGIFRCYLMLALCVEIVEGGPEGLGIIFRVEGEIDGAIFQLSFHAGVMFLWRTFKTGTSDFTVLAALDAGVSLTLLRFLRFGLSLHGEIRHLGHEPTYTIFKITFHIETPWWLPDVSWSLEHMDGSLHPETRPMVSPLTASSAALQSGTQFSAALHTERISETLFSIDQLGEMSIDEAARLARFEQALLGAPETEKLQLVPTDAAIEILFSNPVEDCLGIGPMNPDWGIQISGEDSNYLKLRYRLTGISVRRRARFSEDRPWTMLEEHRQIVLEPDGSGGISGDAIWAPTNLSKMWDADVQVNGENTPLKLRINGSTPFSYATRNLETEDSLLRDTPNWPCCKRTEMAWLIYRFAIEPEGEINKNRHRTFDNSNSLLLLNAEGMIRPDPLSLADTDNLVAAFDVKPFSKDQLQNWPRQIFRTVFDEDAIFAVFRCLTLPGKKHHLTLIAEDAEGNIVFQKTFEIDNTWQRINVSGNRFRTIRAFASTTKKEWVLYVDTCSYLSWDEYEGWWRSNRYCSADNPNQSTDYSGNGNLFFLPNHEYEIAFHAEISARHNSTDWETRSCTEYVYFATKGLPGMNYVQRIGAELEPYVQSRYPGGREWVYGEEPVVLAFNEKMKITLPLDRRRRGSEAEHTQLVDLHLDVQLDISTPSKQPEPEEAPVDWITAHIGGGTPVFLHISGMFYIKARTTDPMLLRLENLQKASSGNCQLESVAISNHSILYAEPFGLTRGDVKYWTPSSAYTASVRLKNDVYIRRNQFSAVDLTAFTLLRSGSSASTWAVETGKIRVTSSLQHEWARFGEADWNHCILQTEIAGLEGRAGFAIGCNSSGMNGLYAMVIRTPAGLIFSIESELGGTAITQKTIPDAERIMMTLYTYDDQLEWMVNGERITAERGPKQEGYFMMGVQGSVAFSSLLATALDMYHFSFRSSRFETFNDHIRDFGSTANQLPLLAGSEAQEIYTAMEPVLQAANQITASDSEREKAFNDLCAKWGVILGQQVEKSNVSILKEIEINRALLLESPEPLDFVADVSLIVQHDRYSAVANIPVNIYQNGSAQKILIIPQDFSTAFISGTYHLQFNIERKRFESTETHEMAMYHRMEELEVLL